MGSSFGVRLVSELLARLDSEDSGRRQLEAREAYINSSYSNVDIFIGISPVMTQKSYDYWVRVNNVTFPQNFELSQNYNAKLAKELLSVSKRYNKNY